MHSQITYPCWHRDTPYSLQWRHNGRDSVSNHQPHDCFLNRLFRLRSKKTSKLRVTGLCAGNSPEAGEFPAQMASNAENISIWWGHHVVKWHDGALSEAWTLFQYKSHSRNGDSHDEDKTVERPSYLYHGDPWYDSILIFRRSPGSLCHQDISSHSINCKITSLSMDFTC